MKRCLSRHGKKTPRALTKSLIGRVFRVIKVEGDNKRWHQNEVWLRSDDTPWDVVKNEQIAILTDFEMMINNEYYDLYVFWRAHLLVEGHIVHYDGNSRSWCDDRKEWRDTFKGWPAWLVELGRESRSIRVNDALKAFFRDWEEDRISKLNLGTLKTEKW